MGLHDDLGEPVLGGTWLYDGKVPQRVLIVACDYDQEHAMLVDDALYETDEDELVTPDELGEPRQTGPDGVLYYVRGVASPGHETLAAAQAWVDTQPWGPVRWDR
jgi:hypothetical protein